MKKLFILFFILLGLQSYSQYEFSQFKEVSLDDLKSRTLLVPLGQLDPALKEKFDDVFKNFWRISKYKIVRPAEVDKLKDDLNYYYFSLEHYLVTGGDHGSYELYYLTLFCKTDVGRRKFKEFGLARWELYMQNDTLRNLTPGVLKLYLEACQDFLENPSEHKVMMKIVDKAEIANMKKNILYIPDYLLNKTKLLGRPYRVTEAEMFKGFTGKYKLVTSRELDRLILEADQPTYVLIFVHNHFGFITIYEAQSHKVVFKDSSIGKSVEVSDLKAIYK